MEPWALVVVQFSTSLIDSWNGHNDNSDKIYKKANWQRVYVQFSKNVIPLFKFMPVINNNMTVINLLTSSGTLCDHAVKNCLCSL